MAVELRTVALGVALVIGLGTAGSAHAQSLPEIRTHAKNQVPACVTPERLMRFLRTGHGGLPMKFHTIASHYKEHGDKLDVRWDYAFFQMILETNYLKFKNNAGQGDVDTRQNNFAGIGTTGGGVPGDAFPDVSTGVLAQIQHLIAYSGEKVANPVGRRTREKQDDIIQRSKALGRAVTFQDLTRRWAVDRRYGSSIAFVAGRYRAGYCSGQQVDDEVVADARDTPRAATVTAAADAESAAKGDARDKRGRAKVRGRNGGAEREVAATGTRAERRKGRELAKQAIEAERENFNRAGLGAAPALLIGPQVASRPTACKVFTASYGGNKNMLIRTFVTGEMHYTALQVLDGQEQSLADTFIQQHARGGDAVGEFPNREAALTKAFDLCPTAARELQ